MLFLSGPPSALVSKLSNLETSDPHLQKWQQHLINGSRSLVDHLRWGLQLISQERARLITLSQFSSYSRVPSTNFISTSMIRNFSDHCHSQISTYQQVETELADWLRKRNRCRQQLIWLIILILLGLICLLKSSAHPQI